MNHSANQWSVVIPAAGASVRFGGPINKLAEILPTGKTVLATSSSAFIQRSDVAEVLIVCQDQPLTRQWLGDLSASPKLKLIQGGSTRSESVYNGVSACHVDCTGVLIHDGARPLISQQLIDAVCSFATAQSVFRPVAPALPVALTVKRATGSLPAQVEQTIPRDGLWTLQTPQAVSRAAFLKAFASLGTAASAATDDLQILELTGLPTWLIPGDERNIKITTQADLIYARS